MIINVLRLIFGLFFLSLGSKEDLRTRTAKNWYWLGMGGTGLIFLASEMVVKGIPFVYFLLLPFLTLLYLYPFLEFTKGWKINLSKGLIPEYLFAFLLGISLLLTAWAGFLSDFEFFYFRLLAIGVFIVIIYVLFYTGLLFGGADAKAMMAITLMMPFYPDEMSFPILAPDEIHALIITYPLSVLFNALFLFLFAPLGYLFLNIKERNFQLPAMLFGYKVPLHKAKKKHVFLMEKVVNGEVKTSLFPSRTVSLPKLRTIFLDLIEKALKGDQQNLNKLKKITHIESLEQEKLRKMKNDFERTDSEAIEPYFENTQLSEIRELIKDYELSLLKERGKKEVWITPKIPFLVPLTLSYGISFFMGSVLFALVEVLMA